MSAPFTPFDELIAAIQLFTNVSGEIQQSAERWIERVQKNLAAFGEQLSTGIAEYERVETEAFEVLKRGGWLGMERHLTGPQVRSVLQIAKTNGDNAANDALRDYFNANECALVIAMSEEWLDIPYLRDRQEIVRDAMSAHRSGHYTLAILSLLPLAEGLSAEVVGTMAKKENVVKAVARQWQSQEQELWTELYSDVVLHVIYKHYDFTKDPAPYLNRNGILHGRVPDYATELNSLRVFLLVDSVAHLWRKRQQTNIP